MPKKKLKQYLFKLFLVCDKITQLCQLRFPGLYNRKTAASLLTCRSYRFPVTPVRKIKFTTIFMRPGKTYPRWEKSMQHFSWYNVMKGGLNEIDNYWEWKASEPSSFQGSTYSSALTQLKSNKVRLNLSANNIGSCCYCQGLLVNDGIFWQIEKVEALEIFCMVERFHRLLQ